MKLPKNKSITIICPGQCVSMDQMEIREDGFIAQLISILTKQRYKYATVFEDQYSNLSFVFLQKTITSEDTLEAKTAFEAYSTATGVKIQHYHTDSWHFTDNMFMKDMQDSNQTISFCGVGACHPNGRAKKRIRDLRDNARRMLLHAIAR